MKFLPAVAAILLWTVSANAQIKNPGFETNSDTAATLPASWTIQRAKGYIAALDENVHRSGSKSLRIAYTADTAAPAFMPFSQQIDMSVDAVRKVDLSVWVKTAGVEPDEGGLWCRIIDGQDNVISSQNLGKQNVRMVGSADWKQYRLRLTLGSDCRRLQLGGRLGKGGTIWYDDFSITDVPLATAPPSKNARQYSDKVSRFIRETSIYTAALNWDSLSRDIALILAGATDYTDAAAVTHYLLSKLRAAGDNHSFLLSATHSAQAAKGTIDARRPTSRLIDAQTAYINVPGMLSVNNDALQAFALDIQNSIRSLDSGSAIDNWIVDLRGNSGGNMYPMIAGLGPLIGDGEIGSFVTTSGAEPWFLLNGRCGAGKQTQVSIPQVYRLKSRAPKIAVLIGGRTASSGEMTTIAFLGKPNTRLFGQASYGAVTANRMIELPDGSNLLVAYSYCRDRTGKAYKTGIQPDVVLSTDEDAIQAATVWLNQR